ncbi:hypothetical protein DLAC_10702 [Tieghemostelium lacteum]|uniref:N-acetyltransferase domain-containing protein n=1 Tax=Tieghemostelium lacteum TaxID=361077 RepID=A0A151Z4M2_TIELA|nr:hypothetical protein DLAC_10702 [Tieghemostelium lacteum]|eukprot:KYQ88891.1 hypothetical protein DLAC_10702 [Tieghemostelium lacteum]
MGLIEESVVQSERLILNYITEEDHDAVYRIWNDPMVVKYLGNRGIIDEKTARNWITTVPMASYRDNGYGLMMCRLKSTMEPVGLVGLVKRPWVQREDEVNIGFSILTEHTRKGYCFEASTACIEYGKSKLGLYIVGTCLQSNTGSKQALEKLGFRYAQHFNLPGVSEEFILLTPTTTTSSNTTINSEQAIENKSTVTPNLSRYILIEILCHLVDWVNILTNRDSVEYLLKSIGFVCKDWKNNILPRLSPLELNSTTHLSKILKFDLRFNYSLINVHKIDPMLSGHLHNIKQIKHSEAFGSHDIICDSMDSLVLNDNIQQLYINNYLVLNLLEKSLKNLQFLFLKLYNYSNQSFRISDLWNDGKCSFRDSLKSLYIGPGTTSCYAIEHEYLNLFPNLTKVSLEIPWSDPFLEMLKTNRNINDLTVTIITKYFAGRNLEKESSIYEFFDIITMDKVIQQFTFIDYTSYSTFPLDKIANLLNGNSTLKSLILKFSTTVSDISNMNNISIQNCTLECLHLEGSLRLYRLLDIWKGKSSLTSISDCMITDQMTNHLENNHNRLSHLVLLYPLNICIKDISNIIENNYPQLKKLNISNQVSIYTLVNNLKLNSNLVSLELLKSSSTDMIEFLHYNHPTIKTLKCKFVNIWNFTSIAEAICCNSTIETLSFNTNENREYSSIFFEELMNILERNHVLSSLFLGQPKDDRYQHNQSTYDRFDSAFANSSLKYFNFPLVIHPSKEFIKFNSIVQKYLIAKPV